ncbi:hypothetical protein BS78_03G191800 [Paspalum vaginatum]|nr:hypothetical protein BS78_03G191800 [Paspalum vaginatum]
MEGTADQEAGGSRHGMILPFKKRALNDQGPVLAESSPEPEVKLEEEEEEHGSVGDGESSVPSSAAATPEEPADHYPLSDAAVTLLSEKLKKFVERGKWEALPEASPAPPPPPPVAEKLMGDAIRSSATERARARRDPRASVEKLMCDAIRGSAGPERTTEQEESGFGAAVQRRLDELRATPPFLLYKKTLEMSDVNDNQNRLLMSCKRDRGREACAITHCVSPAEMKRVENKAVGLLVTAMDQDGVSDMLTLKFLTSNRGYRFISKGWKDFRDRNGLRLNADKRWTRDVELEVWAFRSRKLRRQPPLDEEGKLLPVKDPDTGKEIKDGGLEFELDHHFHKDGGLGVILLYREHTKKRVKRKEGDKDEPGPSSSRPAVPRGTSKRKQQPPHKRDDEPSASAAVAQRAEALANTAAAMSKEEMDAEFGEAMSNAAIGLLMIAGVIPKEEERQEDVKPEQGHGQPPSRL